MITTTIKYVRRFIQPFGTPSKRKCVAIRSGIVLYDRARSAKNKPYMTISVPRAMVMAKF